MARDPRSRAELHRRLVELLGPDHADTLMEALPPHSWDELATRADLLAVKADVESVKADVGLLRIGFERFDDRLDRMDEHWTERLTTTEHKIVSAFRGELNAAISAQTRTMLFSTLGAVLATGGLVLAAARLG